MPPKLGRKPRSLIQALCASGKRYGLDISIARQYEPCDILIIYGWGGAAQQKAIKRHPGRYVAFDLGYWDREGLNNRKWRVSIDGFHCPEMIERTVQRGEYRGVAAAPDSCRRGPILLVGQGPKSRAVVERDWTAAMCDRLKARFPGQRVRLRPKPRRPVEYDVDHDGLAVGDIEREVIKSSLVVCRHSNVAVDACRLGVPVVCEDGAASSIYPTLDNWQDQPTRDQRQVFLDRLGYWQWSITDIQKGRFWPWMVSQLET